MPETYLREFIRGYFDGDGHVSTGFYNRKDRTTKNHILTCGFTSGSKAILVTLYKKLKELNIVKGGSFYFTKGFRLNFVNNDSVGLYGFLYKDLKNNLYLPRKKEVFEKFIAMRA